jgi:hypothetical protein
MKYTVLESLLPVTDDEFAHNLQVNLGRDIPRCEPLPERENNRLAIVGSGPSVRDYLDEIKSFDGEVWAINGAYNFLQDEGIVCNFLGCDPLPGLCDYLNKPHADSVFYIAGTADPTTFDAVEGYDVRMWFLKSQNIKYPPGLWAVIGGTTVLLRAPFLAWMLGFRDLTFFGADSSFDPKGRYCYETGTYQWDSKAPVNEVYTPDGKGPFYTEICLLKQVSQFHAIREIYRGKMEFRCGGLLDAFMRSPVYDDSMLEHDAA